MSDADTDAGAYPRMLRDRERIASDTRDALASYLDAVATFNDCCNMRWVQAGYKMGFDTLGVFLDKLVGPEGTLDNMAVGLERAINEHYGPMFYRAQAALTALHALRAWKDSPPPHTGRDGFDGV